MTHAAFSLDRLNRHLPARRRLARRVEVLAESASTSDELRARVASAKGAACDGWLILTEAQSSGRGRRARDWWSGPAQANLAFTIAVSPPPVPAEALGVLAASAWVAALQPWTAAQVAAKWPNDLMINGAKCGGLLAELPSLPGATQPVALLGCGINVHAAPPAEAVDQPATALAAHTCRPPQREALLACWLVELEQRMQHFDAAGPAACEREFLDSLRQWAPHGVRLDDSDEGGPLLEFSFARGLRWGQESRPLGLVPSLEALPPRNER